MSAELADVARLWTTLGTTDPMWAALTTRRRGGWDAADFLSSGRREIGDLLALLRRRGVDPALGTALDFGCGPGRLSAGLADAGFRRVIGVDVSPSMIDAARRTVDDARCEFRLNSAPDLRAVPSGTVDLLYSARVLQHLPPHLTKAYVREFHRVAAAGGVVAFQLPAAPAGAAGRGAQLLPARLRDRLRGGIPMHGVPLAEVVRMVADSGGVTISVEDDDLAGPRWHSHLYLTRGREDGSALGGPGRRDSLVPA